MPSKFVTVMEAIGRDIKVAWGDVDAYLPPAEALAALLFPGSAAVPAVVNSIGLIQQAVATVEQKFAAAGNPTGTGVQKSAQVLAIVGPAVTQLLAAEKISINTAQIQNIINAVVGVLNVQPMTAATPAPAPVAPIAA